MNRVKINFPEVKPVLTTVVPVRISDINYGGHLGNDSVLSIIHEARVQMLKLNGFTEMNAGGCGVIMADTMIRYIREAFYGDMLTVSVFATEIGNSSFDLLYHISKKTDDTFADIAHAKTGMVCFDYTKRAKTQMPAGLHQLLTTNQF